MKASLLLFSVFWAGLAALDQFLGYDTAYDAGYAAIALDAIVIAVTFGWLWHIRATPMALGMAFSWLGCAGLVGYWWLFNQLGRAPAIGLEKQALWPFLGLYLAGAVAHLRVIAGACGGGRWLILGASCGVLVLALGMALMLR
jgi:hypothetical protein